MTHFLEAISRRKHWANRSNSLLAALAVASITLIIPAPSEAAGEPSDVGEVSWDGGTVWLDEVQCGFSADDFIMLARADDVRLRLAFKGAGTVESVDFADVSSVEIRFVDAHPMRGARFMRLRSMGDMGEYTADAEGATGQLHLRAGTAQALDALPDGMSLTYEFRCSAEYF